MKRLISLMLLIACAFGICYGFGGCRKEEKVGSRYEITAEYVPESGTLTGTTKITFENLGDNEISVLKFQLYPNAYRKDALYKPVSKAYENSAYYAGESYGEMVISSVNGAKGWEVLGEDENILYVYLERSLFPSDKVVLDIGFLLKLARVNHRTGITEKTVNLANFFPILCGEKDGGFLECVYYSDGDPFLSACADYKVTLTAPKEYIVASTGALVSERTLESKKEHIFTADSVRDFALVLSTQFEIIKKTVGGTQISYYYYEDPKAKETLEVAVESFSYFEDTFGAYPYPTYSVVQTGFCLAGMEEPSLVMISDDLLLGELYKTVVHETAHQWWYAVVGSNQIEEAWQDEGLAEYSALLFFENYEKYGFTREQTVNKALKEYRSYYDVYGSVLGRTDTKMSRHLKEYLSDYEYKCLAYDKPLVMLDTLRKSVGDESFLNALNRYYKDNAFTVATPAHLIASFEKTGLDVHGFFDSFLSGKAIL